jgi:hypothetical protein
MEQATSLSSSILLADANRLLALSNPTTCEGDMAIQKIRTQNMVEFTTS